MSATAPPTRAARAPFAGVRLLGAAAVSAFIGPRLEAAREQVWSVLDATPSPPLLRASRASDLELCRRGLQVSVVYPLEAAGEPHVRRYAAELRGAGARVRFTPEQPPCRLIVIDGRAVVAPLDVGALGRGAVVTTETAIVASMLTLARRLFDAGTAFDDDPDEVPTRAEIRVLRALLEGGTDVSAAQRLGISDRTYRRHLTALSARLGAQTRFQLGVLAKERGWV